MTKQNNKGWKNQRANYTGQHLNMNTPKSLPWRTAIKWAAMAGRSAFAISSFSYPILSSPYGSDSELDKAWVGGFDRARSEFFIKQQASKRLQESLD